MSKNNLTIEDQKQYLAEYLVDYWSVSSVQAFARNEKYFEKRYIYKIKDEQKSVSQIIGLVYHQSLMFFFQKLKEKVDVDIDELTSYAHLLLDNIPASEYKPSTTKTIEEMQIDSLKNVNYLIQNFYAEKDIYLSIIQEVVFIEHFFTKYIKINDEELELPLMGVPDLVFIDKEGDLAILDHKSKKSYTPEKDINYKYGNQAVAYALLLEATLQHPNEEEKEILNKFNITNTKINKFYFFENKYSKNKDKSNQIKKINVDLKTRFILGQILFESVLKMTNAVKNPDYVYSINPYDNFVDGGEMIEFWAKTKIQDYEIYENVDEYRKIKLQNKKTENKSIVEIPQSTIDLFTHNKNFISYKNNSTMTTQEKIQHRLMTLNYPVQVSHTIEGWSCTTYLLEIQAGLKISGIYRYAMDIANALNVASVRISQSLVEYEGKSYVAVEVNNKNCRTLDLPDEIINEQYKMPIGRTNYGQDVFWDLSNNSTPHMMIAGATGSGKSIAIKNIIKSAKSQGVDVTILDPKYEFTFERSQGLEVYHEPEDIEAFMMYQVDEMNNIFKLGMKPSKKRLIIFDEAGDCLSQKKTYKTLEENTLRIAQKARSAGIHLLLASQRFSVKILTGDAKANFTTRLCLTVASKIDSQVMLDQAGAERLNGRGDGLFTSPSHLEPIRLQCYFTE